MVHLLCVVSIIGKNVYLNKYTLYVKIDYLLKWIACNLFWIKNDRTSINFNSIILYNGLEKFLHFNWI